MGMVERKMRFGEEAWRLIQGEAKREGVSATAYVREAAIARALIDRAKNDPEFVKQYEDVIRRLRSGSD